jgi:hypothetical protein
MLASVMRKTDRQTDSSIHDSAIPKLLAGSPACRVAQSVVTQRGRTCSLLPVCCALYLHWTDRDLVHTLCAIDSAEHCRCAYTQKSLGEAGSTIETECDVEGQVRCSIAGGTPRLSELERYFDKRPTRDLTPTRTDGLPDCVTD